MSSEDKAQELISIFYCKKDEDVENFIISRAILFEKLGKSRTYLIFDEDADTFQVLAYFTLAMQVLKIPDSFLSNRRTKLLDGFSSKNKGTKITEFPAILIGQIGKNDLHEKSINGSEIMQYCLSVLLMGQAILGGRIVMLECKDIAYLTDLYEEFGFQKLERDYAQGELIQMIKVLDEEEIIGSLEDIG